jgi:hypothetical protein
MAKTNTSADLKKSALTTKADADLLAQLNAEFPQNNSFKSVVLPRLGMFSQDVTEGKGKTMKVVSEGGTFYKDFPTDEEDEKGKAIWEKEELGESIEAIILYQRKQLRHYDAKTERFTSSPVYDNPDEVIPLFCQGEEVTRGTAKELRALSEYQGLTASGKPTSKLEETVVLYVLYNNEVYQMNLRGSSMYSYFDFRKTLDSAPNTFITSFSAEFCENGAIQWNKMTFDVARDLTNEEAVEVMGHVKEIKDSIEAVKQYYAQADETTQSETLSLDKF